MKSVCQIQPFIELFRALVITTADYDQLPTAKQIFIFLSKIQVSENCQQFVIHQQIKENSSIDWKDVIFQMQTIQSALFLRDMQNSEFDTHELEINNKSQIIKVLRQCFVLASKSSNSSYFIQHVLQLSQNSQIYFAEILKFLCPGTPPSQTDGLQHNISHKKTSPFLSQNSNFSRKQIELIDKLYEYQQQTQKLNFQLKKISQNNVQLQQQNKQLKIQYTSLKLENQKLRQRIVQDQQFIDILKSNSYAQVVNQRKNNSGDRHCEVQYVLENQIICGLKNQLQIEKSNKQRMLKSYQTNIQQLTDELKHMKNKTKSNKQKTQEYKKYIDSFSQKCQEYETVVEKLKCELVELETKKLNLQQSETALKFQLGYKNSQIEQLKQLLMEKSMGNREDISGEFSKYKKSHLLQNEFQASDASNYNIQSSADNGQQSCKKFQKSYSLRNFQLDQLKMLRVANKQLTKQVLCLKEMKIKNKQLQYQKKKLHKILRQYQSSRGEQNDILTGCIYELQNRLAKISHNVNHQQQHHNHNKSVKIQKKYCSSSTQDDLEIEASDNRD